MSEFLGSYGFFILIALLMVVCHLGHGRRGKGESNEDERSERGHQP
jgi:hypothetical protein